MSHSAAEFVQDSVERSTGHERAGLTLAAIAGVALLAEMGLGHVMFRTERPEGNMIADAGVPNNLIINYSGFYIDDTAKLFKQLNNEMRTYGHVYNYNYPNRESLDITKVQARTFDLVEREQPENIVLSGQSMGGMVALDVANALSKRGIPVTSIMRYGSPTEWGNIRERKRRGAEAVISASEHGLYLGPVTRLAIGWGEGLRSFDEVRMQLARTACSQVLLAGEAKYMKQFNLDASCDALPTDLPIYQFIPENLADDPFVDNASSLTALGRRFTNVHPVIVPGAAHANIESPHVPYAPLITGVLGECLGVMPMAA